MRIVTRVESGLLPARGRHVIPTPTPKLYLHHSAGALDLGGNGVWWDDVRGIQRFHMDVRGWSDIAYSFVVGGGQIFEGRGAGIAGGHTQGQNTVSHAICLISDYETMTPQTRDVEAIIWLAAHGRKQGWWGELTGGHKDAPNANTACCGKHLHKLIPEIRRRAAAPQEAPMTPEQMISRLHHEFAFDAQPDEQTARALLEEIRFALAGVQAQQGEILARLDRLGDDGR